MKKNYESTADELTQRIVALGSTTVLKLTDPWQLFKVPGFDCSDLEPSLAQAAWALGKAQCELRLTQAARPPEEPVP